MEPTKKLNGYRARTYGDVVAVATLLAMLVSVVAWGLKLEGELNVVRGEVLTLKGQVGNGILPRAEERVRALERRVTDVENDDKEHEREGH